MTTVAMDGFDMYNGAGVNIGIQARWISGNRALAPAAGRFGGQAIATFSDGSENSSWKRSVPSAVSSISSGFAFKTVIFAQAPSAPSQNHSFYSLLAPDSGYQLSVSYDSSGRISVWRASGRTSGVLLGSSAAGVIQASTWHYVEIEATISTTTGAVNLYVDGASVLSLTGQNTQNSGSYSTVQVPIFNGAIGPYNGDTPCFLFDDWYFTDTNTRLGECKIETLRPTGDSTSAWTPNSGTTNFSRVNEGVVDGDTSYVQTALTGVRDLYTIAPLSSTPASIKAVNIVSFAEKTDATTRQLYNSVRSATTDSDGPAVNLAASYARIDRLMPTDPATSAAWTPSGVNNLLIGPKAA